MSHLTVADAEAQVREFAAEFPTPNVLRAVALAEACVLSWFDLYDLFSSSLVKAQAEVR